MSFYRFIATIVLFIFATAALADDRPLIKITIKNKSTDAIQIKKIETVDDPAVGGVLISNPPVGKTEHLIRPGQETEITFNAKWPPKADGEGSIRFEIITDPSTFNDGNFCEVTWKVAFVKGSDVEVAYVYLLDYPVTTNKWYRHECSALLMDSVGNDKGQITVFSRQ